MHLAHAIPHLCYKAAMKAAIMLFLIASPAMACDWHISTDRIDPMTDARMCIVRSDSAKLGIAVYPDHVTFLSGSAYRYHDGLSIRVDDAEPVSLPDDGRSTNAFVDDARTAYGQILAGKRIRTRFRDYPNFQEGDAPICDLPALIRSCQP